MVCPVRAHCELGSWCMNILLGNNISTTVWILIETPGTGTCCSSISNVIWITGQSQLYFLFCWSFSYFLNEQKWPMIWFSVKYGIKSVSANFTLVQLFLIIVHHLLMCELYKYNFSLSFYSWMWTSSSQCLQFHLRMNQSLFLGVEVVC